MMIIKVLRSPSHTDKLVDLYNWILRHKRRINTFTGDEKIRRNADVYISCIGYVRGRSKNGVGICS